MHFHATADELLRIRQTANFCFDLTRSADHRYRENKRQVELFGTSQESLSLTIRPSP